MKNILDKIIWIGLFVLFVPTSLVIASWNSLPGQLLFPVKLGLERTLLVLVSPSYEVSGELQIKYTERRFAEAQRLLADQNSVSGLPYLEQQVADAKTAIENAPNPAARQALATQYIATLTQVSGSLEEQKLALTQTANNQGNPGGSSQAAETVTPAKIVTTTAQTQPGPVSVTPLPTPATTPSPTTRALPMDTHQNPTPTPVPTLTTIVSTGSTTPPQNIVVAMQITQTQQQINQTIQDLQKSTGEDQNKHQDQQQKPDHAEKNNNPDNSDNAPSPNTLKDKQKDNQKSD